MRCKNNNGLYQELTWISLKNAWVPAVTVCNANLYIPTKPPRSTSRRPTVTTDGVENLYSMNIRVTGTVTNQGSSNLTEYGWVWSYSPNPTINDNKVIVGSSSFTGEFSADSVGGSMDVGPTIYARAYATNSVGTSYGTQLTGQAYMCFVEGTSVTLANGDYKTIEEINYNDDLLVWNFDEGKFDSAKPLWICQPFTLPNYRMMKFSNDSELSVASFEKGHRIYNIEKNTFTNLNTEHTPFGTTTLTDENNIISLTGSKLIEKAATFYNIITHTHINMFANGILTSCKLNNLYPISDMRFIKDNRKLNDISEFDVPQDVFEGLRLAEQPNPLEVREKAKTIARNIEASYSESY